jgi:DNA-binding Lrp family transcriptional regulator
VLFFFFIGKKNNCQLEVTTMVKAYIMTCMTLGPYTKALEELTKINHIEKISIVTGEYDIVIKVDVKNLEQLHLLTSQVQKIDGVEKTTTQVIAKEYVTTVSPR